MRTVSPLQSQQYTKRFYVFAPVPARTDFKLVTGNRSSSATALTDEDDANHAMGNQKPLKTTRTNVRLNRNIWCINFNPYDAENHSRIPHHARIPWIIKFTAPTCDKRRRSARTTRRVACRNRWAPPRFCARSTYARDPYVNCCRCDFTTFHPDCYWDPCLSHARYLHMPIRVGMKLCGYFLFFIFIWLR